MSPGTQNRVDHEQKFYGFDPAAESSRDGEPFDDSGLVDDGWVRTLSDFELPDGALLYQECRYDCPGSEKKIKLRRPKDLKAYDRKNDIGQCVCGTGPRRVLYNWPAIMAAGPGTVVHFCEGPTKSQSIMDSGKRPASTW